MEPVREQALVRIVEALSGMTGSRPWGGDYPNPPVVERRLKPVSQIAHFPHLCVLESSGSTVVGVDVGGQAMHTHALRATVYGYVKEDNLVSRSTWLQRLWDDVWRTLLADATLGGVARDLAVDGPLDTDEGELGDIGAFAQDLTVTIDDVVTVG
jgi:hypothetical protein